MTPNHSNSNEYNRSNSRNTLETTDTRETKVKSPQAKSVSDKYYEWLKAQF